MREEATARVVSLLSGSFATSIAKRATVGEDLGLWEGWRGSLVVDCPKKNRNVLLLFCGTVEIDVCLLYNRKLQTKSLHSRIDNVSSAGGSIRCDGRAIVQRIRSAIFKFRNTRVALVNAFTRTDNFIVRSDRWFWRYEGGTKDTGGEETAGASGHRSFVPDAWESR